MLEDVLFWGIGALATFSFFLATDGGQIRLFLLLGEGIGFILYYFSIGTLVIGAAKRIIGAIRKVVGFIYRLFFRPIIRIIVKICKFLYQNYKKLSIYMQKRAKISNTHLQYTRQLLYNEKTRKPRNQRRKGRSANESSKRTKA